MLRVARRDYGLRSAVARLFFVYGPRQFAEGGYKSVILSNFERIRRGERPTIRGDGTQALDYVYIGDAINALLALASPDVDDLVVNVATGRAVEINALTTAMLEVATSDLRPVSVAADWTAGSQRFGDPERAHRELRWTPSVSLQEGLHAVWNWMKDEAND
jgi:UDP-glucose 4-epimerase